MEFLKNVESSNDNFVGGLGVLGNVEETLNVGEDLRTRAEALQDVEGKESLGGLAFVGNLVEGNNGESNIVEDLTEILALNIVSDGLDGTN